MTKRTVTFECATANEADGRPKYWLQARWSDGEIEPCGLQCSSLDELIDWIEHRLDGDTYGAAGRLVHMPMVPLFAGLMQ